MTNEESDAPSHFLKSAEFCVNNNDTMGAIDNFIRAASAYQELQEYRKAAKYYSSALTIIAEETSKDEMLNTWELSHLYKLFLAKNSCLLNLGIIHIWLEKYSLAKLFFIESHKPLYRANSILKENTDYFSNLIDPQIKDIVGITPLQTELLIFAFSSSIFSFLGALIELDADRIEDYFAKLKKLEDIFVSDYFETQSNSFFTLIGGLHESISEKNLISFNEIKSSLDGYYSNRHKSSSEVVENQQPRITLLDSFLTAFKDILLKIFEVLRKSFFNELDEN